MQSKRAYEEIGTRVLGDVPGVARAGLLIEPVDAPQLRALAAKAHGMLAVAKKSLHFELPARVLFASDGSRDLYTDIMVEPVGRLPQLLAANKRANKSRQKRFNLFSCDLRLSIRSLRLALVKTQSAGSPGKSPYKTLDG